MALTPTKVPYVGVKAHFLSGSLELQARIGHCHLRAASGMPGKTRGSAFDFIRVSKNGHSQIGMNSKLVTGSRFKSVCKNHII